MLPIVRTIASKCKRCYSCIRSCPTKAIRVENGQATVLQDRCIACGYCTTVCRQNAKQVQDGIEYSEKLLSEQNNVFAILAPSFPAAFDDVKPGQVISGLRKLDFRKVIEVAFGADLIASEYSRLAQNSTMPIIISSACPAVVSYIEKYYPELLLVLAPIVSPMIATARVIRQKIDPHGKIIFIGPCIAKKYEKQDPKVQGVIDEVLTFDELNQMLKKNNIVLRDLPESFFDRPRASIGRVFPVSGGLLKTSQIEQDILNNEIVVTEGLERVVDALKKTSAGEIEATFLDLLFCQGCINGPKMPNDLSVFVKKDKIINYLKFAQDDGLQEDLSEYSAVSLRREFTDRPVSISYPASEEIQKILALTGKISPEDELNCGVCGYPTCRDKAIAVYQGLAEAQMCLPYMIDELQKTQNELGRTNQHLLRSLEDLRKTQRQLVQSENLASLGQLAAGVAHELNNPLTGILLYLSILLKKKTLDINTINDLKSLQSEAERCTKITKDLLDFSAQAKMHPLLENINKVLEMTLSKIEQQELLKDIAVKCNFSPNVPGVYVDSLQMQQAFLNIIINAIDAMAGKGKLYIKTAMRNDFILVKISDSGSGIAKSIIHKIFDPFFTTKQQGKGTGLGLAIAYGIVKKHGGLIYVKSVEGAGSTFNIKLPLDKKMSNFNPLESIEFTVN